MRAGFVDCAADPLFSEGYEGLWDGVKEHQKKIGCVKIELRGKDLYIDGRKVSLFPSESQMLDKSINDEELQNELAKKLVLNVNILDDLLAHPRRIPVEWRGWPIYFRGTTYRSLNGRRLFIRMLFCSNDGLCHWSYSRLKRGRSYYQVAILED